MSRRTVLLLLVLVSAVAVFPRGARCADKTDAAEQLARLIGGDAAERDIAERKLRDMGAVAIPALREAKPEKDEATTRVRGVLTDIALEVAKIDPADAAMLHEIAREEGKGKRHANAERLYKRAQKLYEKLKDDAGDRKDRVKEQEYKEKEKVCERMKDKAERKVKGESHTGLNLGIVRIGVQHDMSEEWE
ncbi:MAG: hypothetical protein NTW87_22570 [Planctomycetota bacterium]|nr:hypothetical protein [Planctomycetota bacterium]